MTATVPGPPPTGPAQPAAVPVSAPPTDPDRPAAPPAVPPARRPAPRPAPTSLAPTGRGLWRRSRWFLLALAVLLLGTALIAGIDEDRRYPPLDPRSPDASGTRAVVALLERQGIAVDVTTDLGARATGLDTFVVQEPDLLTTEQLRALSAAKHTRLVLISPGPDALTVLAPGVRPADERGGLPYAALQSTRAECSLPEAVRAGSAHLGGLLYTAGPRGEGCYPRVGSFPLVSTPAGRGGDVVVLGSASFLTNGELKNDGNASLALGLLGSQPRLTWYLPDWSSPVALEARKEFTDYIPAGWNWAAVQLAVAAALAAAWRARRLGPVVSENLPVVVRASETTEGRARLYRRAKARGRAAEALRRAAVHRLAPTLGIPLGSGVPDPTALCAAVADRLPARPAGDVQALLYGPPPSDDAALLRLADDLDALERQVRQP
ncbi:DUF4350 domain-containing protein [Kitasatospora sp. NPDC054939]